MILYFWQILECCALVKRVMYSMYKILNDINSPNDLKKLSKSELSLLCDEIRDFLVTSVTKTGGHLASNLGVVELTLALLLVFDFPKDKIVWDVGHQSYVYKIITGRRDKFNTLRQFEGISGFPKTAESEYDFFNTGHSSTSISAALGMARARDIKKDSYCVSAVFGDGAMTGGMIYEAINDAGHRDTPLILILNDNEMSISKNVGALSKHLQKIRQTPGYHKSKKRVERSLIKVPLIGEPVIKVLRRLKTAIRTNVLPSTFFDDLGLEYLGPVDGHNISAMKNVLTLAKSMNKTVLVHVITKKGKGFLPAEDNPQDFHGISGTAFSDKPKSVFKDYSQCSGQTLVSLAKDNNNFITITAAMPQGVGLDEFSEKYPNRFFDVGIAEEHAVTLASGFAIAGVTPVFCVYSSFLQRAYDQILHDVCLQNLHVVFLVDRAGVVGADGETHHGLNDIAFLSDMPHMTVLSPSSFNELSQMIDYAINTHKGPIAIRYPRGNTSVDISDNFEIGKCKVSGVNLSNVIITTGRMTKTALDATGVLRDKGIDASVIHLPTISPIPEELIQIISNSKKLITLEDHSINGGIGTGISTLIAQSKLNIDFEIMAFPSEPIVHGTVSELDKKYGLDVDSVIQKFIKQE